MEEVIEQTKAGVLLRVRVRAHGSRDAVLSAEEEFLRVEVRAAPEKGKANAAVLKLIAKTLDVSRAELEILSGETARDKRILVRGVTRAELRTRVEQKLG